MRALIVDDEPMARQILREELESTPDIEVVGDAENGAEALERIRALQPDLVFIDLQMPVMGGFEVIRRLDVHPLPVVVVVTAYDKFAIEAFEAGAIDYLLKPVSHERLRNTLDRAARIHGHPRSVAESMAQLQAIADTHSASRPRKIVGRLGEEYFLLNPEEVMAFQADNDLVYIITAKRKFVSTHTLKVLQERLPGATFQRVHRNALVNINHIRKMTALSSQRWLLTLANGQEFVVSKRQAKNVRELLG